ncbi:hypothetical protein TST_0237 [Thermosulfidibacter takaii ABI70S6]|uniref:Transporter n=1 Tax=Thermosulfidibacter takaii (strain DSM 17441 / JCM 13301 / NBRC 103674 / ABI70S6) TaxID=1298851 RepID=A0A0S3QRT9_THET7|nr:DUF2162 family putative transporter [Thermosulfidibacter takaii]BAT71046.1 hypothetical protein TST_0237 [Thermosulfidibacter takaii ABI70S6]
MEKYLILALMVAFSAYAAKLGLTLASLRLREVLLTFIAYLAVFLLSGGLGKLLLKSDIVSVAKYGVLFHYVVALGLVAWVIGGWEAENKKSAYILSAPCPFCLLTISLSVLFISQMLDLDVILVAVYAYLIFAMLICLFVALGKVATINVPEVMLGSGVYYLVLLSVGRYYKDAVQVYNMAQKDAFPIPEKAFLILLLILVAVGMGFIRGVKSDG